MTVIPIPMRLAYIESQGIRLKRRIEKTQADYDWLIDSLITRLVVDMTAQRWLLDEWNIEIEKMGIDLQFLRDEWTRLNELQNNNSRKNKKSYGND